MAIIHAVNNRPRIEKNNQEVKSTPYHTILLEATHFVKPAEKIKGINVAFRIR